MWKLSVTVWRAVTPEYVSFVVVVHLVICVHPGEAGGHRGAHDILTEALVAPVHLLVAQTVGHGEHTGPARGGAPQCGGAGEGHVQSSGMSEEVKLLIQSPGAVLYRLYKLVNVDIVLSWIKYQCFKGIFLANGN